MKLDPSIVLYITRTLVDGFRKVVRHHRWIQRPGIILALLLILLAFLAKVQQRRGPKMRPHRVRQPEHTLPRLPEVYRMPITGFLRIFRICSGRPFNCTHYNEYFVTVVIIAIIFMQVVLLLPSCN